AAASASRCFPEPSTFIVQRADPPPSLLKKASFFSSGDNRGLEAEPSTAVSGAYSPVSLDHTQMDDFPPLFSKSRSDTTKKSLSPAAFTCKSAIDFSRKESAMVHARFVCALL